MFRSMPDTATAPPADNDVVDHLSEPIPLSHLELDLDPPSVGGWPAFLAWGIPVVLDDVGRSAISHADAATVRRTARV